MYPGRDARRLDRKTRPDRCEGVARRCRASVAIHSESWPSNLKAYWFFIELLKCNAANSKVIRFFWYDSVKVVNLSMVLLRVNVELDDFLAEIGIDLLASNTSVNTTFGTVVSCWIF